MPNFSKRHNLSETWLSELEAPVQDPDIFFDEEGQESALTLLAHVLREILHWICEGNRNRGGYALTVARKVIANLHCISESGMFDWILAGCL